MTIDSNWLRIFKQQAPDAFTDKCPFTPKVAYIDGMPLLMASESRVGHWKDYVYSNFACCVIRFFKMGCEAVVLAFDEYDHVPKAKSITQANRTKSKAPYEFGDGHQLPPTMPQGFNDKLANRIFKRRVIDMICNTLVQHVAPLPSAPYDRALIIDYSSCPIRFACQAHSIQFEKQLKPDFMTSMAPLGEADVKFLRWAELFGGDIVAHSVDGDFIPISLIRCEQNKLRCDEDTGTVSYKIALHRLKYRMPETGPAKKKLKQDGGKVQMPKREFEYVNVSQLFACMHSCMTSLSCSPVLPAASASQQQGDNPVHYMKILASLIALSGTDFTRGLPHMSPVSTWAMLAQDKPIFQGLLRSYQEQSSCFNVEQACNWIVARIYANKYEQHIKSLTTSQRQDIRLVLGCLQKSKLSDKTKKELPSVERIETTFRNINWLLQYWMCKDPLPLEDGQGWDYSSCFPDPICDEYGFKVVPNTGKVAWLDS